MRGGFRANGGAAIQLLVVTVFSNALRHAEQIVLAAEVKAFRPEFIRNSPLRTGSIGLVAGRRNIHPRRFFVIRIEAMCWLVCFFRSG